MATGIHIYISTRVYSYDILLSEGNYKEQKLKHSNK